jgi:hypothetical protein
MRLTVGSLPPAVYWRRRAVVLGVLLVVVIILWSSCSGSAKSGAGTNRTGSTSSTSPSALASIEPTPTASTALLTPTIGGSTAPPPSSAPAVAGSAHPQCADADLQLVASPETATAPNGAYLKFFLRIKNISGRTCTRDLGPDHQELYLQTGTTKVWSSDTCNQLKGSDVVTMAPNIVHEFNNVWTGLANNNGCNNRKPPGIGKYELFARLDTKISEPATVQLT